MRDEAQDVADAARVAAGDASAFEGIVGRWQGRILSLAWRYCRDRMTAEDMTQEVLLRAFRGLKSFRGDSAFSTWITSIAVNTFRSHLRWARPEIHTDNVDHAGSVAGHADILQERQYEEAVRRAVLTLPARYRDAIILFYFEEKDVAEAARALGLPEGTLKARLHRARELLRQRCRHLRGES